MAIEETWWNMAVHMSPQSRKARQSSERGKCSCACLALVWGNAARSPVPVGSVKATSGNGIVRQTRQRARARREGGAKVCSWLYIRVKCAPGNVVMGKRLGGAGTREGGWVTRA